MKILKYILILSAVGLVLGAGGIVWGLWTFGRDLPDFRQLADYEPPVTTRVYGADGRRLAEFAREKRIFVPIAAIPKPLIQAFLSAEDKNFYKHNGLDVTGILRAVFVNTKNYATGNRPVGASTITQQVAKNFLLSNEVSYERKIREAILSLRIERAFTKDRILELYLNEIYLGRGSYGVAAAAVNYFNKSLAELTLEEMAYLAALPKAPSNYDPDRNYEDAIGRRNWVLGRLVEDGQISRRVADELALKPLKTRRGVGSSLFDAAFFTEEVRRELYDLYGERALYEGGLSVRASLDARLQSIAERELRTGLVAYDQRKGGWRGPIGKIDLDRAEGWRKQLQPYLRSYGPPSWEPAVVLEVHEDYVVLGLPGNRSGRINMADMSWARAAWAEGKLGPKPKTPSKVVTPGDVVLVSSKNLEDGTDLYDLRQVPRVGGALVAMDPHTGRVLAMVGGFSFDNSQFNRATQAKRQPGSAFKPFVYAAALDNGFTPSNLILDAPFVIDQGAGQGKWKPANYGNKFYGPSTLRLGIEKSRNLMTVRLAQSVGMETISDYVKRFDIVDDLQPTLAMALGAGETTLLRLTTAYAMLVNGGKKVTPTLIDRVQDRYGRTIFRHDMRACGGCQIDAWQGQAEPEIPDSRMQVLDPATAYQIVSMLEGVVLRGTGVRVRSVGKPLAGKTGTTNDSMDAWFMGFSPDLVVGVFVGYDTPESLGSQETGSSVAVPIFRDFMKEALKDQTAIPFRIPPTIRLVRVNAETGLPAAPGDRKVILEAFKPGTEPDGRQQVLDGGGQIGQTGTTNQSGTGGLY